MSGGRHTSAIDRSLWEDKRQFRSPCNKCASAKALGGGDTQAAVSNRAGITVCSRCLVQLKRSRVHSLCPSNLWANFTVLIILRVLSICQTHFHGVREWEAARLTSVADNTRPCVNQGAKRLCFAVLERPLAQGTALGGQQRYCQLQTCPSNLGAQ